MSMLLYYRQSLYSYHSWVRTWEELGIGSLHVFISWYQGMQFVKYLNVPDTSWRLLDSCQVNAMYHMLTSRINFCKCKWSGCLNVILCYINGQLVSAILWSLLFCQWEMGFEHPYLKFVKKKTAGVLVSFSIVGFSNYFDFLIAMTGHHVLKNYRCITFCPLQIKWHWDCFQLVLYCQDGRISELVNAQCSLVLNKKGDRSVLGLFKSCTSSCRIERMINPDWRYEELQLETTSRERLWHTVQMSEPWSWTKWT